MFLSLCLPSLKVSDCPSCTHPRRDPRVGFSQFQKNIHGMNTTSAYSSKVFDTMFEEICTTPSMTVISTCEVFVTAESLLVSIWFHTCFSFPDKKTVLEDIYYFRAWKTPGCHLLWKPNAWISPAMYTWRTLWNFKRGQTEGQEHASECLAMPSFQGTGKTSYELMTIRMNSSSF